MSSRASGPQPFETDVKENQGYRYTTTAPLSAQMANHRLTAVSISWLKKLKKVKTVMDLGCGDGLYTAALAARYPQIAFRGCDPARQAIRVAKKLYPTLTFTVADVLQPKTLPRPATDAAIIRGVIHHVPNAAQGVHNVVQYSPHSLIIEPNGWNPLVKIIEKISPYHRFHQERSFTSWTLKKWATLAGAQVTNISYVGLVPFFCPNWLARLLKQIEPVIEKSLLAPLLCAQVVLEIKKAPAK